MCNCKSSNQKIPVLNEFEEFLSGLHAHEFERALEEENYNYKNGRTLLQEVMEEFEDANPAPVQFKKVPFAPLPPEGSYWPLISKNEMMPVISYISSSGLVGTDFKCFGAGRKPKKATDPRRYHAAIDMYADHLDPVVAIDNGTIIKHAQFNGKTYSLVVKHTTMVINYGEVEKKLAPGLKVGSPVLAGQIIGYVGKNPKGDSMLHFEAYTFDAKSNQRWPAGTKAPKQLYNPTLLLLHLKNFGKRAVAAGFPEKEDADLTQPLPIAKNAAKRNGEFATKIGWGKYTADIQKLFGVSAAPSEEPFAQAVAKWQVAQGFLGKKADGILNRTTWNLMKKFLDITNKMTVVNMGSGFRLFGGRNIKWVLCDLKRKGMLDISPNEMEMYRLVSSAESKENISAINNYDKVFMSMGFTQFTIGANTLQPIIERVPAAFKKYGIELENPKKSYKTTKNVWKIKGAPNPGDLRSLEWAKKFYEAGLDEEIIVALVLEARKRLNELLAESDPTNFLQKKFGNFRFPNLWAHIYESNNAAPSPFKGVLKAAIAQAEKTNIEDPVKLSQLITKKFAKKWYRARIIAKNMQSEKVTVLDDATYCN